MADNQTTAERLSEVMAGMTAVAKERKADPSMGGYAFRGIEDVTNAVHPVLSDNGLTLVVETLEHSLEYRAYGNGKERRTSLAHVRYSVRGPDGVAVMLGDWWGEGDATDDKSSNKAYSAAMKLCLLQAFVIPTRDLVDTESSVDPYAGETTTVAVPVVTCPILDVKMELVAMFTAAGDDDPKAAAGSVWHDAGLPGMAEATTITTAQADMVLAVGSDRARHQIVAPAVTTAVKPPTIPDPAIPDKPVEAVTDAPTASDSIPIDVKARRVAVAAQVKAMALAAVRDQLHGFGVDAGATASESRRLLVDHLVTIPHETADDDIDPF